MMNETDTDHVGATNEREAATKHGLNLDRAVMFFAGAMTLLSAVLVSLFSPWWLLLTVFVGLNQMQASITGVCPAAMVLRRFGVAGGCAFK